MSFLVSVHEIMKRPGQMRELELDIELLEPMGTAVVAVPKGGSLEVDLRLESVYEGILATGEVFCDAQAQCSRCLEEIKLEVVVDFQELFAYSVQLDDELKVDGEHIDLMQVVTDSVVLSLPFQPVCQTNCPGLCAECGFRMVQDPGHQHENAVDSRFSALEVLLSKEE